MSRTRRLRRSILISGPRRAHCGSAISWAQERLADKIGRGKGSIVRPGEIQDRGAYLWRCGRRLAPVLLLLSCGCATTPHGPDTKATARLDNRPAAERPVTTAARPDVSTTPTVRSVAYEAPATEDPKREQLIAPSPAAADPCDPFVGQSELRIEQLVLEVEARNPSLQATSAAWRAAAARYPQVVSLDDPMFAWMVSPSGVGSDMGGGWMVQASQKFPWPGKRAFRGSAATAEANAMQGELGDTRLRLAEMTRTAYYDYYLAARQQEVNSATQRLLTTFRTLAKDKYQVGQTTQQDVLQADVELASLESRTNALTRDTRVAMARINTLLHREADCPLPPPPEKIPVPEALPPATQLQQIAAISRPDLYTLYSRMQEEQANRELALREYYPDVNVVAKYDAFMPENMRSQVGMDVNIPLHNARRAAAVAEAEHRLQQRCWEYQDRLDQVRYEVQAAWERADESRKATRLLEERTLPAAQRSLESAQINYTANKIDFLRLLDTQRQLLNQREMYHQATAEYHRRLAELERAVGTPIP